MTLFAPRIQTFCPRCQSIVRVPESLPLDVLSEALALRQAGNTLQAVSAIARSGCADLQEAKHFVLHLPERPGHCARCDKPLPTGAVECPVCHSVTLHFDHSTA
jgi:hypothetical protein